MVREQTLKHRGCQNPACCFVRVKPVASPCSSPGAMDSPGGSSRGLGSMAMGWRIKCCGHWVLWARWAHGWRLGTPDAVVWVGGSAWLYLPSLASLCQVTSLALSPSMIF